MGIQEFAELLQTFFIVFDGYFLHDPEAEELLTRAKESLKEKIQRNESALPVIMALGGRYDSEIDRAKVKELEALLSLLGARKELQTATLKESRRDRDAEASLQALFGI